jgi:hypothetical protein
MPKSTVKIQIQLKGELEHSKKLRALEKRKRELAKEVRDLKKRKFDLEKEALELKRRERKVEGEELAVGGTEDGVGVTKKEDGAIFVSEKQSRKKTKNTTPGSTQDKTPMIQRSIPTQLWPKSRLLPSNSRQIGCPNASNSSRARQPTRKPEVQNVRNCACRWKSTSFTKRTRLWSNEMQWRRR